MSSPAPRPRVEGAEPGSSSAPLAAGSLVGQHTILRLLARGSMGEVYLARDARLGRKVAIKLIAPEHVLDEAVVASFLDEAQATAACSHPGIVTVFALGEHAGVPYLVLEYVEGRTLRERLEEGPPGVRESLRLGIAVAEALREAHRRGILHLDLKPENVMIGQDGRPRVVDFGLARLLTGRWPAETAFGTPSYMAPEQWRRDELSPAADIWALGVILHELLDGSRPFGAASARELGALVTGDEPLPGVACPDAPTAVKEIVGRCLERRAELRPSAAELADALAAALGTGLPPGASPFRGLAPFVEEQAGFFFGRDDEITELVERLRDQAVLPVVGVSGAGKSSLIRAGLIPRLAEQRRWSVLTMRPGPEPFASLALALSSDRGDAAGEEPAAGELSAVPTLLGQRLRERAARDRAPVLLCVDQIEEIVTLVDDDEVRARFLRAVCLAADDASEPVRVIFAARDDFLSRLAEAPEMRALLARGHITVLHTPGPEALSQILHRALAASGHGFDDPTLSATILRELDGDPAALAHLQFALAVLWEQRDPERRLLRRAVHDAMGGVAGALATSADAVLAGLSPTQLDSARTLLLRLVTAERTRRALARGPLLDGMGDGAATVLDRLLASRLLGVRSAGPASGEPTIELAHEALIVTWRQLARWLDEGREEQVFLVEIGKAAARWQRRGRREDEAWTDETLRRATRSLRRCTTDVPEAVRAFVAAGERRQRRRRARRRWLTIAALGLATALTAASLALAAAMSRTNRLLDRQRDEAEARQAAAHLAEAQRAFHDGSLLEARASVRAALELRDGAAARALWARMRHEPLLWAMPGAGTGVAILADGRVAVAGDGATVQLVEPRSGRVTRVLRATRMELQLERICASLDGRLLAVASSSGEVGVFHLPAGDFQLLARRAGGTPAIACGRDAGLLAVADGRTAEVVLLDAASSAVLRTLATPRPATSLALSSDGALLALTDGEGVAVRLVATGAVVRQLPSRGSLGLDLGPDGTIAIAGAGGALRVLDLATGMVRAELDGHERDVQAVKLSPDGTRLASAGFDRDVLVWDLRSGTIERRLRGHGAAVESIAFSADGETLAAGAQDGVVRLYDLTSDPARGRDEDLDGTPAPLAVRAIAFGSAGEVVTVDPRGVALRDGASGDPLRRMPITGTVALAPSGAGEVAVVSADALGTVRLRDLASATVRIVKLPRSGVLASVAASPDGARVAVAELGGSIRLLDVRSGAERRRIESGQHRPSVSFSPDGALLVAASAQEPSLTVWDLGTGRQRWSLAGVVAFAAGSTPAGTPIVAIASRAAGVATWDASRGELRTIGQPGTGVAGLCLSPGGKLLAAVGYDHRARIWDVATRSEVLSIRAPTMGRCAFSADGRLLATAGDTVRLWSVASGRPVWRAPFLGRDGRLVSHGGWVALDAGAAQIGPGPALRRALEELALAASEAPLDDLVCVAAADGHLDLWQRDGDQPILHAVAHDVERLLAIRGGCAVLAGDTARLFTPAAGATVLASGALAMAEDGTGLLIAHRDGISAFSADGTRTAVYRLPPTFGAPHVEPPRITAVARVGDMIAIGFEDGRIELEAASPDATPHRSLGAEVASAVVRIAAGPRGALLAGHEDGVVVAWDPASGVRLGSARLRGAAVHLFPRGSLVHAASDLGDRVDLDLGIFAEDRCTLLREVWAAVPAIWESGAPRTEGAPADHPCRVP